MTYYYFVAGTIGLSNGNETTNSEVSLPAPIDSYSAIKEVERRLAGDFSAPAFVNTFYQLLGTEA
ncbi:MAG TPA: hypothetical protein VJZ91_10335 [Blastocatellia bacterium]|nr:hypothetical protein [Blastocatellia bacterium]